MIIGITGTLAAGKGTIVEFLKLKGFEHHSVRDFLIEEIKKRDLSINRDSMVLIANELRAKHSPSYIVEQIYEKARLGRKNCIIESLRAVGEVEILKGKDNFYLFSVDANPFLRYERAKKRKSETDNISYNEFLANEKREFENEDPTKGNLKKCIEMADFNFENNGTPEELEKKIGEVLQKIGNKVHKRKNYLSWDEYFMGMAILSKERSKDPSTQVGACIINENNKIIGTGYNGAPIGFEDDYFPWERKGDFLNTKYAYVCHAEINAILNSTKENLKGCTLYVLLFPCNECAKAIIQSGIKKIVYLSDKYKDTLSSIASKRMLEKCGVELICFKPKRKNLKINFEDNEFVNEPKKEVEEIKNNSLKIRIKKLHPDAQIPNYAKYGDAAMDLSAVSKRIDEKFIEYGTGLSFEIPEGYVGLIFSRSSVTKKDLMLKNSVGVLDSGYRGELMIRFQSIGGDDYEVGERVAQLIVLPYPKVEFEEVRDLENSERGIGGFGSSGIN